MGGILPKTYPYTTRTINAYINAILRIAFKDSDIKVEMRKISQLN